MQVPKKIPMRMCLGCGEKRPKRELIRIVRSPEGAFSLDPTGRKNGRGCYICGKTACFDTVCRQKKLARSYGPGIGQSVYDQLMREWEEYLTQNGGGSVE